MKNNSLFSFLWKETKQYRLRIIAFEIFALICFGLIPMFIQPAIFGSFLNSMANKTLTINSAIFLSLLYTLFFISTELCRFLFVEKQLWYGGVLKAKNKIIKTNFNYAINHSQAYFSNKMSGVVMEKIKKISTDFVEICDIGGDLLAYILSFIVSIIVYLNFNFYLFLSLLGYAIVFLSIYYIYLNVIFHKRKELTIEEANCNGLINDDIMNIQNIKAFSNQKFEEKNVKKQDLKILRKLSKLFEKEIFFNTIFGIINISFMFAILGISVYLVYKKQISIGTFVFISQNITMLKMSINKILRDSKTFVEAVSDATESYDTIFEDYDIKDKPDATDMVIKEGKIVFKNITFKY